MTTQPDNPAQPVAASFWHVRKYRFRRIAAVTLAISPPILSAYLAETSGNWEWFERSGSITTAVGLLVASRRYIEHGVLELALLQKPQPTPDAVEILEDVVTAKLGLALSAFGTLVWGWGKYTGWWSFSCLLVWGLFAARDARRDSSKPSLISPGEPEESAHPKITRTG